MHDEVASEPLVAGQQDILLIHEERILPDVLILAVGSLPGHLERVHVNMEGMTVASHGPFPNRADLGRELVGFTEGSVVDI